MIPLFIASLLRPRVKSRYRWACVEGMWRWWDVSDLQRYRTLSPGQAIGGVMDYLP